MAGVVLRTRDCVVNGESRVTTTYHDSVVEAEIRRVLETFSFCGPIVAQFLQSKCGGIHIIEINARFGGASTAAIAVGLDVWLWTLRESFGLDPCDPPFTRCATEFRQLRVSCDLHIEVPR